MRLLFLKFLNLIERLLRKYVGEEGVKSDKVSNDVKLVVEPEPVKVEESLDDPEATEVNGPGITHCLWKPVSDTSPEVVIVVAADTIRREHLVLELRDSSDKIIKLKTNRSYSDHRGNQLPDHKLGRFNFKPGFKIENLKSREPITVKFFIQIGKKKHECKIGGKDSFVIKDVSKRWICTAGRVRLDPKK
jgi:hypothetical protein